MIVYAPLNSLQIFFSVTHKRTLQSHHVCLQMVSELHQTCTIKSLLEICQIPHFQQTKAVLFLSALNWLIGCIISRWLFFFFFFFFLRMIERFQMENNALLIGEIAIQKLPNFSATLKSDCTFKVHHYSGSMWDHYALATAVVDNNKSRVGSRKERER